MICDSLFSKFWFYRSDTFSSMCCWLILWILRFSLSSSEIMFAKQHANTTPSNSIIAKMVPAPAKTINIMATWFWKELLSQFENCENLLSPCFRKNYVKSKRLQGDPNQNIKFLLAITLKICVSDPILVKPKCVLEVYIYFDFSAVCLQFSAVCLQFSK